MMAFDRGGYNILKRLSPPVFRSWKILLNSGRGGGYPELDHRDGGGGPPPYGFLDGGGVPHPVADPR
ncbi:hypothetical protein QYF36_012326 [Acer negundo]|nr:hypothetical protein QYF36_012326 [Acer negundo]